MEWLNLFLKLELLMEIVVCEFHGMNFDMSFSMHVIWNWARLNGNAFPVSGPTKHFRLLPMHFVSGLQLNIVLVHQFLHLKLQKKRKNRLIEVIKLNKYIK